MNCRCRRRLQRMSADCTPDEKQTAHVSLKDGRVLDLAATVQPPRPKLSLISKNIQPDATTTSSAIQLEGQDELPQNAQLSFSLKTQVPADVSTR